VSVQTVRNDFKATSGDNQVDKNEQISNPNSNGSGDEIKYNRFECKGCGYIYDPSEGLSKFDIPKGTSFLDLEKEKYRCPVCRAGFDAYVDIGPKLKPSGFEENLGYGFGFNNLPSGQKNVLIFGSLAFAAACFLSLYSLR
tara:strand:- start:7036 stop:7458 length:423 start_codon:yes stop_codon:yes gene_type:complete